MEKACLSVILSDQVEDDVKDTIYQTTGIPHAVIPDTSGIAFLRFQDQVGNDRKA